jgi:four helix bundle protein
MNSRPKTHRDLRAWQKSMALAEAIYRATASFPDAERFGLAQQMRRAAVSIVSNIAEGAARNSPREFVQFLAIARGSLAELETQLELAVRLSLLEATHEVNELSRNCGRLVTALLIAIRRNLVA